MDEHYKSSANIIFDNQWPYHVKRISAHFYSTGQIFILVTRAKY